MSDDRRCETCAGWQPPVRHWGRWCVVLRHHTGPIDTCDHYREADVQFTCETCAHWGTTLGLTPRRVCDLPMPTPASFDLCEHYKPAVPFTGDPDGDPIERYAAERDLLADEAAMEVVMADHELLGEIAKSTECVRAGKRLLTSDEVFGTDSEEVGDG